MAHNVFEFAWNVAVDGYRWINVDGFEEPILTDAIPLGGEFEARRYFPLRDHSGLFREFADTEPTKEGFLAFANRYGLLGEWELISLDSNGPPLAGTGERISLWHKELYALKRALELWDFIRDGDLAGLATRIYWRSLDDVVYSDHPEGPTGKELPGRPGFGFTHQVIANSNVNSELLERFRPGDLVQPAQYYVQKTVNDHLKGRVSPRLLWTKKRTRLALFFVPQSLIGALWLQFALAIDGNKDYRRCEECRSWFEVSPEGARTTRVYCSTACRVRAYRRRIAQAKQMFEEGKSIGEIARLLDSDEETVRGWVGK